LIFLSKRTSYIYVRSLLKKIRVSLDGLMLSNMPQASSGDSVLSFITHLSESDLRSLMTTCLQHCEVLLPAGWMPVMTRGEWTYPELEHDTAVCLKLTIEEVLWTLEGFFDGGVSASRPEIPGS